MNYVEERVRIWSLHLWNVIDDLKGRYYWAASTGTKTSCREHFPRLGKVYPGIPTKIKSNWTLIELSSTTQEVRNPYPRTACLTG